jgi:hypothetical protein
MVKNTKKSSKKPPAPPVHEDAIRPDQIRQLLQYYVEIIKVDKSQVSQREKSYKEKRSLPKEKLYPNPVSILALLLVDIDELQDKLEEKSAQICPIRCLQLIEKSKMELGLANYTALDRLLDLDTTPRTCQETPEKSGSGMLGAFGHRDGEAKAEKKSGTPGLLGFLTKGLTNVAIAADESLVSIETRKNVLLQNLIEEQNFDFSMKPNDRERREADLLKMLAAKIQTVGNDHNVLTNDKIMNKVSPFKSQVTAYAKPAGHSGKWGGGKWTFDDPAGLTKLARNLTKDHEEAHGMDVFMEDAQARGLDPKQIAGELRQKNIQGQKDQDTVAITFKGFGGLIPMAPVGSSGKKGGNDSILGKRSSSISPVKMKKKGSLQGSIKSSGNSRGSFGVKENKLSL